MIPTLTELTDTELDAVSGGFLLYQPGSRQHVCLSVSQA